MFFVKQWYHRPFRKAEKRSEENAANSDSLNSSGKSEESPPCGLDSSSCKLDLFALIKRCMVLGKYFFWIIFQSGKLFTHGRSIFKSNFIAGNSPRL